MMCQCPRAPCHCRRGQPYKRRHSTPPRRPQPPAQPLPLAQAPCPCRRCSHCRPLLAPPDSLSCQINDLARRASPGTRARPHFHWLPVARWAHLDILQVFVARAVPRVGATFPAHERQDSRLALCSDFEASKCQRLWPRSSLLSAAAALPCVRSSCQILSPEAPDPPRKHAHPLRLRERPWRPRGCVLVRAGCCCTSEPRAAGPKRGEQRNYLIMLCMLLSLALNSVPASALCPPGAFSLSG